MMTTLYRHFDEGGLLLYVGISFNAFKRTMHHKSTNRWWLKIAVVKLQHFDSREAAEKAEKTAILNENPQFNVRRYSIKRGVPRKKVPHLVGPSVLRSMKRGDTITVRTEYERWNIREAARLLKGLNLIEFDVVTKRDGQLFKVVAI